MHRVPGDVPATALWVALAVFLTTVLMCSRIRFVTLTRIDGLSWFGVQRETAVPFVAGVLTVAGLQVYAAAALPDVPELAIVRRFLRASALLMVGILVTPYSLSAWMELVHDGLGTCLFLFQLVFGAWYWATRRGAVIGALLLAQLVAGVLAAAALIGLRNDLFFPQVVYQLAFAAHLPLTVRHLAREAAAVRR
jgi:predicted small integral membrane protein